MRLFEKTGRKLRYCRLDEVEAAFFFEQLASAVSYLQSMGICHRDLKP